MPPIVPQGMGTFSSIPGSQGDQPANNGGPDPNQLLASIAKLISDPSKVLSTQSVIPQAAAAPMPTKQYGTPSNLSAGREFATKGGHQRAAMADLFNNVGEIVKTAEKNSDAKKARTLALDMERVILASENPNDPKNQQVLNDILSDPKKRKEISEAMGISFTGEEDTRKPHQKTAHSMAISAVEDKLKQQSQIPGGGAGSAGTVQGAPTNGNGQSNYTQQLLKQLPNVQGLSPQMQAVMSMVKANVLPGADKQLEAFTQMSKQAMNDQSREQIAQTLAQSRDRESFSKYMGILAKNQSEEERAKIGALAVKYRADSALKGISNNAAWRDSTARAVQALKNEAVLPKENLDKVKALKLQADTITKNIKQAEEYITKNDKWYHTPADVKAMQQYLQRLQTDQKTNTEQMNKALEGIGGKVDDSNTGEFDPTKLVHDITGADGIDSLTSDYNSIVGKDDDSD